MGVGRLFKAVLGRFRSSLQIRALVYTVALSGSALVILGGILSVNIGNGLFSTRIEHAKVESSRAEYAVQRIFDTALSENPWDINQRIADVVPDLELSGVSQTRLVAFINRSTQVNAAQVNSAISSGFDLSLLTKEFKARVRTMDTLQSQTIQVIRNGESVPAILTGQKIDILGGHSFDLYLVYDMANEQQTLAFIQRVLFFGGLATISIIGFFSFVVTSWLVRPIRRAAEASELIAKGDLSRRLPVKGTDDVAILATSFNRMAEALQDKISALNELSQMQQRFVSDVSHELRTPLTTMRLSSDLLYARREHFPDDAKRAAELLFETVERFDRLLADLLEISRYDAANVTPHYEMQDMNGIVGSALEAIQQLADSKGVYLEVEVPSGPVRCEVDSRRIDRILNNLLTNAIEHSEGKPIKIKVAQNSSATAVTVTDNGVGLSADELSQVFDRFWRADPSRKRTTGGTGLGLAISIEDALAHNGTLDVTGELGVGACFRLTIPNRADIQNYQSPLPLIVEKINT